MAVGVQMQQRRTTEADWTTSNYVLAEGELGVSTDTGIIKIGDGVNGWAALQPAFDSQYLPILGKASDSELLDGMGSEVFAKVADVPTTVAMGSAIDAAKTEAIFEARRLTNARTLTDANFELQLTDAGKLIVVTNTVYTPSLVCTIPNDSTTVFDNGATIDIASVNKGSVNITPAAGVTLRGKRLVYGGNSITRLVKLSANSWMVTYQTFGAYPRVRRFVTTGYSCTPSTNNFLPLAGDDTTFPSFSKNHDSMGANEQWSSGASDRLICRREGWYNVHGQFALLSVAATKRAFCDFDVNGTVQYLGQGRGTASSNNGSAADAKIPLNVNDYVRLVGWHDDAVNRTITNAALSSSYLEWEWASPL
jgi:major tropism determinant Mtd-like protein